MAESLLHFLILPDRSVASNTPSRRQIGSSLGSNLQKLVGSPLGDLLNVRYPNRPGGLILPVTNAIAELCKQLADWYTRRLLAQDGRCNVTNSDRSLGLGEVENATGGRLRAWTPIQSAML